MREIFKPLRNHLRKFNRIGMLQGIWVLANHIDFGKQLPGWLQAANPSGKRDMFSLKFFLWELDTLAREAIMYCQVAGGMPVNRWDTLRDALNLLKAAEDAALSSLPDYDVFAEVGRIAHRQFHWQQGVSHQDLTRTSMIYSDPALEAAVARTYGAPTSQVVQGGFALAATFMKYAALTPPWTARASELFGYELAPILAALETPLSQLRDRCMERRSFDHDWAYTFNPLWLHPLIRIGDAEGRVMCPLPGLLLRRLTGGLYFDIVGQENVAARHLGPAYQRYVGRVLEAASRGGVRTLAEVRYGPKQEPKDSVDWLVEDDTGVLFVECKVLKTSQDLRTKLVPADTARTLLGRLAEAIGQTYATMADGLAGNYPHWKPSGKPAYPVVVTLDDWNLFSHVTAATLRELVEQNLVRRRLDPVLVEAHPFAVWFIQHFETGAQVMFDVGIGAVMRDLNSPEKAGWLFSSYLRSEFADALGRTRPLFPDEHRKVLPGN